ncbi:unnamed protein product [Chrysoparadoxa australica]
MWCGMIRNIGSRNMGAMGEHYPPSLQEPSDALLCLSCCCPSS